MRDHVIQKAGMLLRAGRFELAEMLEGSCESCDAPSSGGVLYGPRLCENCMRLAKAAAKRVEVRPAASCTKRRSRARVISIGGRASK